MGFKQALEKFHDENRYFIPLVFVAFVLIVTGFFHNEYIIINHDVLVDRTLLFDGSAVIQAVTLRPGWSFYIDVLANRPVTLSLYNLESDLVAESPNNTLRYTADFLNLYFVMVDGSNYAILDFNYSKQGTEPYSTPYLFFGSGLALLLGVLVYYFLEPWKFKFKRVLDFVDAIFYPVIFLLSSIVFWVFRDSLIWFLPKSLTNTLFLTIIPLIVIIGCFFVLNALNKGKDVFFLRYTKKSRDFFKSLFGYIVAYSAVFITIVLDYSNLLGQADLLVPSLTISFLIWLYVRTKTKNALVIYSLTWLTSLVIKVLAYSVGVPVIFDTFLTIPSSVGAVPLFIAIESFIIFGVYFLIRGYYARDKARAINYGLYASVFIQAFLQVFSGTSLL